MPRHRYKEDTLAVKYKGRSINDVLEMPIAQAYEFFKEIPKISQKLKALVDVGLGYVHLGQSAVTLSGGESQRMKLASELYRKDTGNTLIYSTSLPLACILRISRCFWACFRSWWTAVTP